VALLLGLGLTGCGGGDDEKRTALTISVSTFEGNRTFELRCDPPGGTAPNPKQLCASLSTNSGDILFRTFPLNFGPSHLYIGGVYQGRVIEEHAGRFPASWWNVLVPAAIATPDAVPVVREPRTFKIIPAPESDRPQGVVAWPSTLAQAGDIVVCIVDGKRYRTAVPKEGQGTGMIPEAAPGEVAVSLMVTNGGGVVTAPCVAEV